MSENTFATELSTATTGGHYSPPTINVAQATSSLGQLSNAIEFGLDLPHYSAAPALPLIIEQGELTPEQKLHMYLTVARRSQQISVMENAFALALRTQRTIVSATLSNTMPTALKIKTCEIPVLKLFLEFGLRSPEWRALVVIMLCDNVENGCGHLTVNRAKQVLKELAKRAGATVLATELSAATMERRMAAVILLGWLKHERAIEPLVDAYDQVSYSEKKLILSTLETHYLPKLAYYLKWRRQAMTAIAEPLLALLETA
jgi:hypothetical protein